MVLKAITSSTSSSSPAGQFNVTTYGAKGDGMTLTDLSITNGLAVVTSATYQFTTADEGKMFAFTGVGTAGVVLPAHIVSTVGGAATLSQTAHATKTGNGVGTFGTDDSAAIQAAITAASVTPLVAGGVVQLNAGIYVVASSLQLFTRVSFQGISIAVSILKWISEASMDNPVLDATIGAAAATPFTDCHYRDFTIDCIAAFVTAYTTSSKGLSAPYQLRGSCDRLYIHDTPATGLAVDYALQNSVTGCIIVNAGRLNNGTTNAGGNGIGNATGGGATNENWYTAGNFIFNAKRFGIFWETQSGSVNPGSTARTIGNYIELGTASSSFGIGDCGLRNSIVANNTVVGNATGADGIVCRTGTVAGSSPGGQGIFIGNTIIACTNGITISYGTTPSSEICKYIIANNRIQTSVAAGIAIVSNAAAALDTLLIEGNNVSLSGTAGLSMTGAGGFKDVSIKNNQFQNNALTTATASLKAGISITSPITRLRMVGNDCFDNQGSQTQAYGLIVDTVAVTGALIQSNDFSNNLTGSISLTNGGTIAGTLLNNLGYNSVGRVTAQTAAAASIATITVPASDSSYRVSANVLVTASTTHSFTITCAYTDEGNTARTLTFPVSQLAGTIITAITNVTGAGPYEGVPLHIRCKAGTTITIATTGTFTSVTYNAEAYIEQLMT